MNDMTLLWSGLPTRPRSRPEVSMSGETGDLRSAEWGGPGMVPQVGAQRSAAADSGKRKRARHEAILTMPEYMTEGLMTER